jgi:hypothetical protein
MNKKGVGQLILFSMIIGAVIVIGLFIAIFYYAFTSVSDVVFPAIKEIGMVGETSNVSAYATTVIAPFEILLSSFKWFGGLMYALAIFGLIGLAVTFRLTMSKVFIVFFLALAILLIIVSILISNTYEELYTNNDDVGLKLQEQVLLSFLILNSPMIFTIVIFVSGIILFSGIGEETLQ